MPSPSSILRIPQPCSESWATMTPSGPGRHCAACQQTVVDFTHKTDAEILAYLARAAGDTCGRFDNDQLNRPLRPATATRPASRWRAWLALAVAMWGLRASPAAASTQLAGPPSTVHPPKKAGPTPSSLAPKRLRGTVHDAATHEPLAGVAVFLKGENRSTTTDSAGHFSLRLPARRPRTGRALVLHFTGYQSETVLLPAEAAGRALPLSLRADPAAAGAVVVGYGVQTRQDVTGGLVVVTTPAGPPPTELRAGRARSLWQRLKRPFWP